MSAQVAEMSPVTDRISVKIFFGDSSTVARDDLIGLFHRWIQESSVGELLIDVHDYSHVPDGPGVMLVANEAHYRMDEKHGQLGIEYARKRLLGGDWSDRLQTVFGEAIMAAQLLENDVELAGSISIDTSRMELRVEDRLVAPNTSETREWLLPIIEQFADRVFDADVTIGLDDDPRAMFGGILSGYGEPTLTELLKRFES